ncbi:MAG: mucoidy inhibitor MuiA family protein [Marinilabiliaceae bacterium]|nr:mucoidy inhibitor MuiA family protein [Marinilabiliaceae bacterium]
MKTFSLIMFCICSIHVFAQGIEKEIKTKVDDVTVFIEGAQIVRKKSVELPKGETILKFIDLSPFIDGKSVQVKAKGNATVLSVNHQFNFVDKLGKPDELKALYEKLEAVETEINLQNTHLQIIREDIVFLQENRDLGGRNQELNVGNLKEASVFYSSRLTALKLNEIERNKKVLVLNNEAADIRKQIQTITSKDDFSMSEIVVKVDAKTPGSVVFELSYFVGNAGWFPSYDVRAKSINDPIQIIYKANVHQDTRVDWNNVKLHFSSADPNLSGIAPQLKTYYLNYNTSAPKYGKVITQVSGKVMSMNREPLIGVNVIVDGTTIGAVTDYNGNYSITIPNGANALNFSFIGYISKSVAITSSNINVFMDEEIMELESVAVTRIDEALQGRIAGVNMANRPHKKESLIKIRGGSSLAPQVQKVENQTTANFDIEIPYTIKSENKTIAVDMQVYEVDAAYQYYAVPKLEKDAFLLAYITNWEQYSLMEGEANIYFEDTYIGKTILDVRYATDTLELSLGRDKNVSLKREKVKDYTTKQFIGNKKEVIRDWKTIVKNNKSQEIDIVIYDQVPVSTLEEIEVEVLKTSGAKIDSEIGKVKWELKIKPREQKELELKYSVKHPKNRFLNVE